MANIEEPTFTSLSARIAALTEQGVGEGIRIPSEVRKSRPALPSRPKPTSNLPFICHTSLITQQAQDEPTIAKTRAGLPPPVERKQDDTCTYAQAPSGPARVKPPDLPARKVSSQFMRRETTDFATFYNSATPELRQMNLKTDLSITNRPKRLPPESEGYGGNHTLSSGRDLETNVHKIPLANNKSAPKLPSRVSSVIAQDVAMHKVPLKQRLSSSPTTCPNQGYKVASAEPAKVIPSPFKANSLLALGSEGSGNTLEPKATIGIGENNGAVQELTDMSINDIIRGKSAFVKFYVRECKSCRLVEPHWKQLAENFAFNSDKLLFGQVDAELQPVLCTRYGISSYPTMLFFDGDKKSPEIFPGEQPINLETMTEFLKSRFAKIIPLVASPKPPQINFSSKPSVQEIQAIQFPNATTDSSKSCLRCRDFSGPDKIASQYPYHSLPRTNDILGFLVSVLCGPFNSETDKARAIFTWLHHNIAYDVEALFNNRINHTEPQDTIASGLAVCGGYAGVFQAIAQRAGLEVITIVGHGKGYGYTAMKPGDRVPPPNPTGHAWNAVRIDGDEWKLIDSCWGAGTVNGMKYTKSFAPREFTRPNEEFGIRHFPQGDFFMRADGVRPSWEEYMRGLGSTNQEPLQEFGNVEDDHGISLTSFSPPQRHICVTSAPLNVRFQFSKVCEHFDYERLAKGKPPLFLLCLNGSDDPWLPFNNNEFWWWVDVPRSRLIAGRGVGCFVLTTVDGRDAGGITKQEYLQKKGRLAIGFAGVSAWELV